MTHQLAHIAARLAKDLKDAVDIAYRSWLFEGKKAYGAVLWEALTPEGRREANARETELRERYLQAKQKLVDNAPRLLEIMGDDETFIDIRIQLEIARDMAGHKYQTDQTALNDSKPNHLHIMPVPNCIDAYPAKTRLLDKPAETEEA